MFWSRAGFYTDLSTLDYEVFLGSSNFNTINITLLCYHALPDDKQWEAGATDVMSGC